MTSDKNNRDIARIVLQAKLNEQYRAIKRREDEYISKIRATGHDIISIKMADDFAVTVVKYPCFHTLRFQLYNDEVHEPTEYVINMKPDALGRLELYVRPFCDVTDENAYEYRPCIKDARDFIYDYYYHITDKYLLYKYADFLEATRFISYPVNRTKAALRTQEY